MARANVNDFIRDVEARGYNAVLNVDGSVRISKGAFVRPSVFWNIQNWVSGAPGAYSKAGPPPNSVTGFAETDLYGAARVVSIDTVSIVDAGVATTADAEFFLNSLQ